MSEHISSNQIELEPPIVSAEAADAWVLHEADALYDTPVTYDRGRGAEQFRFQDAVRVRMDPHDPGNKESFPGMILQAEGGQAITIDTRDYLQQAGFDGEAYLAEKRAEAEHTEGLRRQEQQRLAAEKSARDEQLWQESMERRAPFYKELFSPIMQPKLSAEDEWDPDTGRRTHSLKTYRSFVNDLHRQDSAELLSETLQHDQGLLAIISSFDGKIDLHDPLAVVDGIRENPDLRFAVGMYYVDKIHHVVEATPAAFEFQVRQNTEKMMQMMNPSRYHKIRSRDNVALICLAMLDGSFAGRNPITKEKIDPATLGTHHRPAANYIIYA